jgi:hypothetical protein
VCGHEGDEAGWAATTRTAKARLPIYDAYVARLEGSDEVEIRRRHIRFIVLQAFVVIILVPVAWMKLDGWIVV